MIDRVVRVVAASRLHFGMLSVNQPQVRRYGGLGAMVDAPGLELVIRPAARLEASGPLADRALSAARLAARCFGASDETGGPACRIDVLRTAPLHVGLGTGTQLAMAVAAGLNAWLEVAPLPPEQLAQCVGRGKRSAIGLYGFAHGGLLYETGKSTEEEIAPLVNRVELPTEWRFVLVRPMCQCGLSGEAERDAFARLPPVPVERTETLYREAADRLMPAAAAGRFDDFSESLYQFGYLAGLGFAERQGGAFHGERLASLVERIRSCGVRGVGQSSWGPTLFALVPNDSAVAEFLERFGRHEDARSLELTVAIPQNEGARIEVLSSPNPPSWMKIRGSK